MKTNLFILAIALFVFKASAQTDSLFRTNVEYSMQFNFSGYHSYQAHLFFDNTNSLFEYKERSDTKEDSDQDGKLKQVNETNYTLTFSIKDTTRYFIKRDIIKNETSELVRGLKKNEFYQIIEPVPPIKWSVTEEAKKINEHLCYKATCDFRGRHYIAWFTPEIQTSFGPLKLDGLPGLILELTDETREISLYAKAIKNEKKRIKNESMDNIPIISRTEYKKKKADAIKLIEESLNRISSRMNRGSTTSTKMTVSKDIEID